jgi:hypothetical protein
MNIILRWVVVVLAFLGSCCFGISFYNDFDIISFWSSFSRPLFDETIIETNRF